MIPAEPFDQQVSKKAFKINRDPALYGSFAEIGAGQEVARQFFSVGGAAGTVAKTMSAYDMTFSDSIYGYSGRYVSEARLNSMLEHEFELLIERLDAKVGSERTFFAFADTVAARSFRRHDESHGWMGIRFQSKPRQPTNDIILHVRMLDPHNLEQQEALGIVGVNLIYGAFYLRDNPEAFLSSLLDNLEPGRIEIDMIRFSGPDFVEIDNRIMALQLVALGLTDAALFRADGEVVSPADAFYKKPLLVERGSFRPVTLVTNDMLDCARSMFLREETVKNEEPEILMEITMKNLLSSGELDLRDFLNRVDMLRTIGRTVLISKYGEYYRLVNYLTRYTDRMIGLPLGVPALVEIFEEQYYRDLEGGILEGLGRLFKKGVKLYVYPFIGQSGELVTADNFLTPDNLGHLYNHLITNGFIEAIEGYQQDYLKIRSSEVLAKIRAGDSQWEKSVSPEVASIIRDRRLFGFSETPTAEPAGVA
ncbi:nicotinate-nucleotide adenylyltransferase [Spartobacteria bacterium LR76]|nr:nicotinate-nucleotide adenylyltransferase [Spartobacteria bacterium LR76]